ncbi:hypothetical protein Q8G38_10405 [Halomonas venusta]|uniref:hypothetical protein n=1 Tax=Vreelandella venusta TaxID=44935 RepID=UPI00295E2D48|nr:hypothetical protein [Halomonas venusta]MDW0359727.1 hypothetical protein [Halomonas venusta]
MMPTDCHSRHARRLVTPAMPAALSFPRACRPVIPACLPPCHSRVPAALSFPRACRPVIPACF